MVEREPLVSVLTATYNRSNVLSYTIQSLLGSRFEDWEQIVVGDGCTDDTEDVVRSFGDPRITFFNLPHNTGDEAEPHNHGLRVARGRYIAYLNHDDLWLPNHLDVALAGMEETSADLVWTIALRVSSDQPNSLSGVMPGNVYWPLVAVTQSAWLVRRELLEEIGPWRQHHLVWTEPAQDLLVRAWKRKKVLRGLPQITVVRVPAGGRPDTYSTRACEDNETFFLRMQTEPDFLQQELLDAFWQTLSAARWLHDLRVIPHLRLAVRNLLRRAAMRLGVAPMELKARWSHKRRGAVIDAWRTKVGLPQSRP